MRKELENEYSQRKSSFEQLLRKQKKILAAISFMRLAVMVLAIWFLVLGVKTNHPLIWISMGLFIVLFFVLVSYHKNQNDKRKLLAELIKLNDEELSALKLDFSAFPPGNKFIKPDHPWSHDLDIFGERSLFQYMNRTATHNGPGKLAGYLSTPVTDTNEIKDRQELIRELSEKINLRQQFTAHARLMDIDEEDYDEVVRWSGKPVFIESYKWTYVVAWIMSSLSLILIVLTAFMPTFSKFFLPLILVNLGLLSPFVQRTNRYQVAVSKKHRFLKTYSILLDLLSEEEFEHPVLNEMSKSCKKGSGSIRQLSSLLDLFDQRLNLLAGFILNALFLFDFFMLHRLAAWNRKHKEGFAEWLENAGNADALFSLAGFRFNHPEYSFPKINADYSGMEVENLGHPMISENKRIDNSLVIKNEKVVLITGANMAGKSTFLRAVGVNMVLAYAGCPVCATSFRTGNYKLFSSMRTADSLKDDESYFFAEIKRLKVIVDLMEKEEKMLILLDEVLKGTNTTDKQKGSRGLIEKSIRHDVLCFIATHDLSLGEMEKEHSGQIVNYCFESYIKDLELTFDYRIMPGLAKNMNASFLMKKMGIMD